MSWIERLRTFFAGSSEPVEPLPPRRERREAARERHHETGEPAWSEPDRHEGPEGEREVQDIAPGLFGEGASHRVIDD
jgi:hypothetical protein